MCAGGKGEGVVKGEEEGRRGRGSSWIGNLHHAWQFAVLFFSTAVLGKKKKPSSNTRHLLVVKVTISLDRGGKKKKKKKHNNIIQEIQKLCLIAERVFHPSSFLNSTADLVKNISVTEEWARVRVIICIIIINHHISYYYAPTALPLDVITVLLCSRWMESLHYCALIGQDYYYCAPTGRNHCITVLPLDGITITALPLDGITALLRSHWTEFEQ